MFLQKRHKINYLKLSISLVLSILFTYNSWNGLMKPYDSLHASGLSPSGTSLYVNINTPQPPTISSWVPILNSSQFNFVNNYYKELVKARQLDQIIAKSKKIKFAITIIKPPGFYNYFVKRETDEHPVLS